MCLYPRIVVNKKYLRNKKNGGIAPVLRDKRHMYTSIGCGKCFECKRKIANDWRVRLLEEIKTNKNGKFVLLTFREDDLKNLYNIVSFLTNYSGYELDNAVAAYAMRRFLERWRKKFGKSVRHWFVTELGQNRTERLHLHGILWTDESFDTIEDRWMYGFVGRGRLINGKYLNFVNEKSISYVVKYVHKTDNKHPYYKSKVLCSAGIGSGYIIREVSKDNIYNGEDTREFYRLDNGGKIALPVYYRNKIYSEEERENLWSIKLDKEIRFVNREEVKVNNLKGLKEYERLVEYWRKINKEMGFGGIDNYSQKAYEFSRRNLVNKRLL